MALTLEEDQKLTAVGLVDFLKKDSARWKDLVAKALRFTKSTFPDHAVIRPDDVSKILFPLLEVDAALTDYLNAERLTQKYWRRYYCNLIIDRFWDDLTSKGDAK